MFEGKPPLSGQSEAKKSCASVSESAAVDTGAATAGEELRAVSWSELVAKLGAARDLRGILLADAGALAGNHPASFDANSARRLAASHEPKNEAKDEPKNEAKNEAGSNEGHFAVNPSNLGNRKGEQGKDCGHDPLNRPDTRGNT